MEYYVDTAEIDKIKKIINWLPLDGVTMNPSLVAKSNRKVFETLSELLALTKGAVHVQVMGQDRDNIIKEADKLSSLNKDRIYVKIPVSKEGLAAIKDIDTDKVNVTATAVFTVSQAITASKAGAKYVAPYFSRVNKIEQSGLILIKDIQFSLNNYNYDTKVLAASVKNAYDVKELYKLGVDAITVPPEIYEQAHQHSLTAQAIEIFNEDWLRVFEDLNIDSDFQV